MKPMTEIIQVLDRVRLTEDVTTEGITLKMGSEGTAVFKHRQDDAFEVEFFTPIHAVVGVHASKLEVAVHPIS
jgi:hypothetical protein